MSPKSRGRRRKPGARAARPPARRRDSRRDDLRDSRRDDLRDSVRTLVDGLYVACEPFRELAAPGADPLTVEIRAAQLIAGAVGGGSGGLVDLALGTVALAARHPEPHIVAAVTAIHHFLPGMATSMALRDLRARALTQPEWATALGNVTPRNAWHCQDAYGEQELFLLSFAYGPVEHAILVETARCPERQVRQAEVSVTVDGLRQRVEAGRDLYGVPFVLEEIPLDRAREALAIAMRRPHPDCEFQTRTWLPIVASRVDALPEASTVGAGEARAVTAEERDATARSFLAATAPPAGVEPEAWEFWARALVGATATATGDSSPTRIGPMWLEYVLGDHLPRIFELTPGQRAALAPATAAWAAWAAEQQGLAGTAVARLAEQVAEIEVSFDKSYDDPDAAALRSYIADVADSALDGRVLANLRALRLHAVPTPDGRPPTTRSLPVGDPDGRRQILVEELRSWGLAEDQSESLWLEALISVSEQLWHRDPPELAELVVPYLEAEGFDPGLLGDLTELAVEHCEDRGAFLEAARERLEEQE